MSIAEKPMLLYEIPIIPATATKNSIIDIPVTISGFIMAFTLSLDDFVISYFVGSSDFQTLPLLIYSMTKKKVTPDMYALSTLIIITIFVLLLITNIRSAREEEKRKRRNAKK